MSKNSMSVGDAIKVFLRRYRLEDKLAAIDLEETTMDVLGPELRKWVSGIDFHKGTLTIRVQSAAMRQELSYHKSSIKEEINQKTGKDTIVNVQIK